MDEQGGFLHDEVPVDNEVIRPSTRFYILVAIVLLGVAVWLGRTIGAGRHLAEKRQVQTIGQIEPEYQVVDVKRSVVSDMYGYSIANMYMLTAPNDGAKRAIAVSTKYAWREGQPVRLVANQSNDEPRSTVWILNVDGAMIDLVGYHVEPLPNPEKAPPRQ